MPLSFCVQQTNTHFFLSKKIIIVVDDVKNHNVVECEMRDR